MLTIIKVLIRRIIYREFSTIKKRHSIKREKTNINEFQWPKKDGEGREKSNWKNILVKNVREIKR